jgi:predicted transcriptional regulator of viral defense system
MSYFDALYEVAADNYGLITTAEAKQLGVPRKEMHALTKRGRLSRQGHGVYRLTQYVPTPNDPYALAVTLVGPDAYLYGESVIAMHSLAPTNPARIFVATPARVRKTLPRGIIVIKANDEVTSYEGIPSQHIVDAIRSCKGSMMPTRLIDATNEARRLGYIQETEKNALLEELK